MKSAAFLTGIGRLGLVLALSCAGFLCLFPAPALAEATAQERALSESLFVEGKRLLDAGNANQACPKLAESQRLDPGGGTQLLLGLCWEETGRIATAWLELKEALALALRDGRESRIQIAREHIAAIEPRLSRIEFRVSEGADVPGLAISRNGTNIPRAAWSVAMPFDPGEHDFEVSAPGHETATVTARIEGEGQLIGLEIPLLKPMPDSEPPPSDSTPTAGVTTSPEEPAVEKRSSVQPIVGWALVGGAAAFGGIGSYFGARALSLSRETKEQCPGTICEVPSLEDDYEKAGTAAKNANVAFISAGVLMTAGIVTLLTHRTPKKSAAGARPTRFAAVPAKSGAQLHIMGEF